VRIVHVIARFNQGGTAGWLTELIEGQRRDGNEVYLLAGKVEENEQEDIRFTELGGIRIQGLSRHISLKHDLIAFYKLRKKLISINPDIVNTHTAKAGLIGRLCVLSLSKKNMAIVHTFHGHILYGYFGKLSTKVFVEFERVLGKVTDVILVSGEKVKRDLLSQKIGDAKKFIVVRPGIRPVQMLPKSEVRKKFSIPEDKIVIGWLGRLTEIKRPDRVLELAKLLPNYIFMIGGDGELLESLKVNAPSNIVLTGWTTPTEIWSASDLALLTSDNEAQPLSLIEAASAGLPLIGEDVGSVSEVIQDQINGYLTNNLESRMRAIQKLATDTGVRERMGNTASQTAVEFFGVEQFLNTHICAYKKALSGR
jgi:glycosyltransferase involved in cell wall biosynthesis